MRSRLRIVLGLVLVALWFVWWATSGPQAPEGSAPGAAASHPVRRVAEADPDEPTPTDGAEEAPECDGLSARVSELADQVAETCRESFALDGLCPPPVPFPADASPAEQTRQFEEDYRGCGLSPGDLFVDCSEYPCFALLSRSALERKAEACDALRELRDLSPSAEEHAAVMGLAWAGWIPVWEPPEDLGLQARVTERALSRLAALERRLISRPDGIAGSRLPPDCARASRALTALASPQACEALREYWDCPPIEEEHVTEERYQRYVDFAERVLDELVETCPHLDRLNTFLDCSSVPCLIVADTKDLSLGDDSPFCNHPDLSSFTGSGWVPEVKIAVAYLDVHLAPEAGVRARFEREGPLRILDILDRVGRTLGTEP